MDAGRLLHRVRFERPKEQRTVSGDEISAFVPCFDLWAEVKPSRGRELYSAAEIQSEVDTRIAVRWSPTSDQVDAKWRILHLGIPYNIVACIHVDMARDEIQFLCKSGRNEG